MAAVSEPAAVSFATADAQSPEVVVAKNRWRAQLEQDRGVLLGLHPFIAAIALQLEIQPVLDDRLKTACTDGYRIFFSIEFLQRLPEAHRLALIGHEVWHCVAGHFVRRPETGVDFLDEQQKELWNLACDHEVNHLLLQDEFVLPKGAVFYRDYAGKNAEQVYQLLKQDSTQPRLAPRPEPYRLDQHEFGFEQSAARTDPDYSPEMAQAKHKARHEQLISKALEVIQQQPGAVPGHIRSRVNELLKSKLRWQELLRNFIAVDASPQNSDWQRPNRRYLAQGLFLPRRSGEYLSLLVAVDTSGSTSRLLPVFLSELVAIASGYMNFELRVLSFDTRVTSDITYTPATLHQLKTIDFRGGGGTRFAPVFDLARQLQPKAMICFTDGYAEAVKQPPFPVLWALPKEHKPPVDWGITLHITENK